VDDLPDEMDLASSEYLQSFQFRLRGREKTFLKKIDLALAKIDNGTFGICEDCGEPISVKRLEARPETALCIRLKEDQERTEKAYGSIGCMQAEPRRGFLKLVTIALGGLVGAVLALPAIRFVIFPTRRKIVDGPEGLVPVASADAVGDQPLRV